MEEKIGNELACYVIRIPQLLLACGVSFLSGHIWLWLIYTYFKDNTKGITHLKNIYAKTGLGVLWHSLFLFVTYIVKFGFDTNVENKILSIILFSLLLGMFAQALVVILIVKLKK